MVMEDRSQHTITAQTPAGQLPSDVQTLRQMVHTLLRDVDQKALRLQDLESQLAWFKRHLFGRRSEKYPVDHPTLFAVVAQGALPKTKTPASCVPKQPAKTPQHNGRQPLPAHLPRERTEHTIPQEKRLCNHCGQVKTKIGQEVTEELDYIPSSFVVREHIRPKYVCKQCQNGVVIADLPGRPVDKGRAGTGLFSHVIVSKYGDHLPLNRQEEIYKRHGLDLRRSTLCDWVAQSADLLRPIVLAMKRQILQSPKIHTDDTTVPVRNGPRKQIRKGYVWVYIDIVGNVFMEFTARRVREGPLAILSEYTGYIQVWAQFLLPKNPLQEALVYLENQWEALNRYADDPLLAIDNNLAEQTLRRIALGRKNWLFAGSDQGAHRAAIHYSLIASCKLCQVDPFHYIKDVLDRISSHPASRVDELLPCNWKPQTTEA